MTAPLVMVASMVASMGWRCAERVVVSLVAVVDSWGEDVAHGLGWCGSQEVRTPVGSGIRRGKGGGTAGARREVIRGGGGVVRKNVEAMVAQGERCGRVKSQRSLKLG